MSYKTDGDIISDALMARVRELEAHQDKLTSVIEKLNIRDYLLSQFVFSNQDELLNDFAKFAEDNYKECAHHYGYKNIDEQVVYMLEDLAGDIDISNKDQFAGLFTVLGGLKTSK